MYLNRAWVAPIPHQDARLGATPQASLPFAWGCLPAAGAGVRPQTEAGRFDKGRPGRRTPKACLGYGGQTAKTPAFAQPGFEGGTEAGIPGWKGQRPIRSTPG